MRPCEEFRGWIHRYVDGDLSPQEQMAFEAHLVECADCRAEHDSIRQIVDTIRGSNPLYPVAPDLQDKVRAIVEGDRSRRRRRTRLRAGLMAGSFAATILLFALLPVRLSHRFTSFAADTHLRYAKGSLPLGVSSDEPMVVSGWLQQHLPFHLGLPNFPAQSGEPKSYTLVGAKVLQFDGQDVAYLAYMMGEHPISLLVTSSPNVIPSSGKTYVSGKLQFHFSSETGLKLITWRDRGLSYALVSDLQVSGAQSCVVCHGSQSERRKFENLQSREGAPLGRL